MDGVVEVLELIHSADKEGDCRRVNLIFFRRIEVDYEAYVVDLNIPK